jgi:DNA-directed RNA polymerase specialized sigma24 family protein
LLEDSNTNLLQQIQDGNISAMHTLIQHYQAPIQNYLLCMTGDIDLSRELAEETFSQAISSFIDEDTHLAYMLYLIATNLVIFCEKHNAISKKIGRQKRATHNEETIAISNKTIIAYHQILVMGSFVSPRFLFSAGVGVCHRG